MSAHSPHMSALGLTHRHLGPTDQPGSCAVRGQTDQGSPKQGLGRGRAWTPWPWGRPEALGPFSPKEQNPN